MNWLGGRIPTHRPRVTVVKAVRRESKDIRTLIVEDRRCAKAAPGQFAMIWVPGVSESPMSLSYMDGEGLCGFTVKPFGATSTALTRLKEGDSVGVRGPYGNGFTVASGSSLVVGGGTGLAPLLPLTAVLVAKGGAVTFVLGGRSRGDIIFLKAAEPLFLRGERRLVVTTDDGSYGVRGVASDYVADLLKKETYDMIYTCGPEAMMKKIFTSAEKKSIPIQASLERYMKCGFGLCGSCAIGRYLVCVDGPVFNSEQLREVSGEFGVSRRDSAGRSIPV